jgi:hypothetical protein
MALNNPNGLKTQPSTKFGTPELEFLVVTINDNEANSFNAEGEYLDSNSDYSKAVRALQTVADVYAVFEPSSDRFTAIVHSNTLPKDAGEAAGDGGANNTVTSILSNVIGFSVTVWAAELVGDNLNYD